METFLNGDEVMIATGRHRGATGTIIELKTSVGHGGIISKVQITSGQGKGGAVVIFQSRFELINRGKHNPNLSFKRRKGAEHERK